ncbi:MAG: alpha/beta hydrolase family protein [Acidimicrobiales bacterium]
MAATLPRIGAPQVSGDGTVVFPQTEDGAARLMALSPSAPPRVLSSDAPPATGTLGSAAFALHPNGDEVAYVDTSGRLVRVGRRGGPARVLCSEGGSAPRYSPDGSSLAMVAVRASGAAVTLVDLTRPDWPRPVTPPLPGFPLEMDWSPDGQALAVALTEIEEMPWDCGQIWHVPLHGTARPLVGPVPGRHVGSPRWLDDQTVVYVTDERGWLNLWRVDVGSGRREAILEEPREHLYPALSPDRSRIAYVSRRAGDARLAVLELSTGTAHDVHPEIGVHGTWFFNPGERVAWMPDGRSLAMLYSGPGHPARIGQVPADGSAPPRWLTDHGLPEEVTGLFSAPIEVTWQRDGRTVQGWLHLGDGPGPGAAGALGGGPRPLAVHLHGGPTGDAALWWYSPIAHLVAAGWAVLDVNYRGSVGFGRDYLDSLVGEWGSAEVEDAAAGVAAARTAADLSDRTAVFGLSAGGFSTVASLLAHPEIYAAGVAGSGVYDLVTLSEETVPQQAYYLNRLLGPSSENFATYVARSPLHRAADLRRPVLIWHGTAAPATPVGQSRALAAALEAAGREHVLRIYEGEGYGGLRVDTTRAQLEDASAFLARTVLDR